MKEDEAGRSIRSRILLHRRPPRRRLPCRSRTRRRTSAPSPPCAPPAPAQS